MIWEQQTKVIIMLTDLVENGVEKCAEYIPPSEVTDCHRLFGDFQATLKKRETKEKYAISTLHLKVRICNIIFVRQVPTVIRCSVGNKIPVRVVVVVVTLQSSF